MRAVLVAAYGANPGEKGRQLRAFTDGLLKTVGRQGKPDEMPTLIPGITPGVLAEAEPGAIEAERERQRQAAERIEAEHRAAWEAQRHR